MPHHSLFAEKHFIAHIDSHDRLNGEHQDGEYKININNGTQITDYNRVCLLSATIPKSYYAVEVGRNTFVVDENGVDVLVNIPIGTYNATDFRDTLIQEMNNASLVQASGWVYDVTFSSTTAKYTWLVTGNGGVQPIIKTTENVYEQLGFLSNSTNPFSGNKLTSETVIDLAPENNVFIRSNICVGADNNSDILQDISASGICPFGQIPFYQVDVQAHSRGLNTTTDVFRFSITNEDEIGSGQRILDLNGKNWTCTLLLYKSTEIYDSVQDLIKLLVFR